MSEHTIQDQRWYRVEHRVSGFDAGFFAATSPEEAIAAMMTDADCDDEPSPDWIATEVELVQMIRTQPYEDQGFKPLGLEA
jgi:CYTH domain-containing protein